MKRKICIITGTRAEYGLFYPILKEIEKSDKLELQLVVSTMHLSSEFGLTYKQIEKDGFKIDDKIENLLSSDSKSAIAKSTGLATILLSDTLTRLNPDLVLLLGDRYETFAAATTAMLLNIPIAHIHGGEITQGAVDEQIRHAITKMGNIHFTSTKKYKKRIMQMGENKNNIFNVGAPGIDNIINLNLLSKDTLEKNLNWKFGDKSALFTYHPVTLENSNLKKDINSILNSLKKSNLNVLFTYANADDNGRFINTKIEEFCKSNPIKYKVFKSLGQLRYLSAMKYIDILVGNTSSGIIEAASFKKIVINIGNRQKGRLQSNNIINTSIKNIDKSIQKAINLETKNITNIYGNGKSSKKIIKKLESIKIQIVKKFVDKDCK